MDAMYIFPALLALMIAALTALGYALQRIGTTTLQAGSSSIPQRACLECGQWVGADAKRCPVCGRSLEAGSMFVDVTPHNHGDMSTPNPRQS